MGALVLAGCQDRYEWHQKVTVTVQTPDGLVSASSVQRVIARFGQMPLQTNEVNHTQRGEAVTVDLGNGRYLFALFGNPESVWGVFADELPLDRENCLQTVSDPARRPQGARRVPREWYPRLVTFADIDRPETVRRVDPNRLSAHFGPGYRLVSITMEITDEPVTEGRVESVLGWLESDAALDAAWQPLDDDAKTAILGLRQPIRKNQ